MHQRVERITDGLSVSRCGGGRPARAGTFTMVRAGLVQAWPLMGFALLGGCGEGGGGPTTQPSAPAPRLMQGYIAFVGAGETHPLWPVLRRSAENYSESVGTIEVRYLNPAGRSPQDQINLLRGLTDPAMRGLCVQVEDPLALPGVIDEIEDRGVAIVPMIHPLPGETRAGFAGLNNEEMGTLLADATARVLGGHGSIMLLHAGAEHPVYGPRLSAFDEEIERHRQIEVFARVDCHGDALQARRLIRERSERFPRLSAWVSLGEWATSGLTSEQALGLPAGCRLITCGGGPEQWPLIRSGRCPAVVVADYHRVGAKALQFGETAIRRASSFESRYVAPLKVIDAAGLDQHIADWQQWLASRPAASPAAAR